MKVLNTIYVRDLKIGEIFALPWNSGFEIYCKLNSEQVIFLADDWDEDWEGDYFSKCRPPYPTLVKPGDVKYFGDRGENNWLAYKLDNRIQALWKTF